MDRLLQVWIVLALSGTVVAATVEDLNASLTTSAGGASNTLSATGYPFVHTQNTLDAVAGNATTYRFTDTGSHYRHELSFAHAIESGALVGTQATTNGFIDFTATIEGGFQLYGWFYQDTSFTGLTTSYSLVRDPGGTPTTLISGGPFSGPIYTGRFFIPIQPGDYRINYSFTTSNTAAGERAASHGNFVFAVVPLPPAVWAGLALLPLAMVKQRKATTGRGAVD